MYEESTIIDQITIIDNIIHIRQAILVKKNGEEIAKQFHRYCLNQNDNISLQPEKIRKIAEVIW